MKSKESFGSRLGFVLAAAGSAVGLGNIWRFPYLAAKYGGGIFLLVYIVLAVTFGFSLMLTEIALGRKTRKSTIGAYKAVDSRFSFLGVFASFVPFIICPYYCVIGGWVLKYLTVYVSGNGEAAQGDGGFFSDFISSMGGSTLFFIIFAVVTAGIVIFGVQKGIEGLSKVLMPVLLILIVAIAIYTMTIPGAMEGVKYYLLPNFEGFGLGMFMKTLAAAAGQMFYSMSIAMGIMITYGSYMRKEDTLEDSVRNIEIFDTGVAILAGLIIVPSVFAFSGGDSSALNAGPSLMFITLPNVFGSMKGGQIVGAAFFILVALAALTSSISLFETMVSILMEKFNLTRLPATVIGTVYMLVIGMTSVLGYSKWSGVEIFGYQILDFYDFISNNVMMPITALATCILIGYVAKTKYIEDEVLLSQEKFGAKKMYRIMIRVFCPIFMILILLTPFFVSL